MWHWGGCGRGVRGWGSCVGVGRRERRRGGAVVEVAEAGVAVELTFNEISSFAPRAGPEAGLVVFIVVVVYDAEADEALDAAVEVEEGGAHGDEDEDGEEEVEPFPEWREVDEAAEEVVEGRFAVDGWGEEGHEVIGERDGELGDLHCVPEGRFMGCITPDEGAPAPDAYFGHGCEGCGAHIHYPG